jgi:anti-sigma regulatory factor (Ser/Thr protein kinase)
MHYMETCETTFELANDLTLIRSLANYFQEMLRCLPLGDETERLRVGVALEEAMRNAYYHGNLEIGPEPDIARRDDLICRRLSETPYRDRRIHVRARISRAEAVFTIRDDGPGFDVSRLPTAADLPDDSVTPGRGVVLMRTIMDEVVYNLAGNEVTLVKRKARETAPEQVNESEQA